MHAADQAYQVYSNDFRLRAGGGITNRAVKVIGDVLVCPLVRPAQMDDVPAIARVHVDTWRTTYVGIGSDEHLASLSYERCQANWVKELSNPQGTVRDLCAEIVPGNRLRQYVWPDRALFRQEGFRAEGLLAK